MRSYNVRKFAGSTYQYLELNFEEEGEYAAIYYTLRDAKQDNRNRPDLIKIKDRWVFISESLPADIAELKMAVEHYLTNKETKQ